MSLSKQLKKSGATTKREPVWAGPESDADNGGITFSMLCRFLTCRERFRLRVIEGLKPVDKFDHKIEFGNMWHACEEAFADNKDWLSSLTGYVEGCCAKYRTQQEQIIHWASVCRTQFPLYINWWKKHPDIKDRTPLLQEHVFKIPYPLPSGRTVYLRGKWDSVDLVGKGKNACVWLMENKTKGDIDEGSIGRQLNFDLQTMMYLVTLKSLLAVVDSKTKGAILLDKKPIGGVRYNVIRRPLSGGSGSIKRKEPTKGNPQGESAEDFYGRLGEIIENAHGGTEWGQEKGLQKGQHYFFMRWNVEISERDIEKFRRECLDTILENLCYWYDEVTGSQVVGHDPPPANWRHPFGCDNTIDTYGYSDLDNYLETGSMVGLQRNVELFEELKT